MKKHQNKLILLVLLALTLLLSGCGVTVIFDPAEGTVVSGEVKQRAKTDAPAIPPEVERAGYVFDGWEGNYETPEEKTTVKATWRKLFNVTFDTNGGTAADTALLTQSIADGDPAVLPAVSREGYEFDGWDCALTSITADTAAKAQWTKLYRIVYDIDGGVANDESLLVQTIREGEAPVDPTVTKDKYVFKGWERTDYEEQSAVKYTAIWERRVYDATEIYALVNPATVEVSTYRRNNIPLALGSGFFIKDDGTFVTNYHVIKEAFKIRIKTFDSTEYEVARVIYYDADKDIAVLKANVKDKKVAYLEYSDALPAVGEVAYALGSSLGLTGTFSSGIVSYVNRKVNDVNFVQTTAPISSGNSGGPLVNKYGQVIGINTSTYTEGQNLNLSIAVSETKGLKYSDITVNQFFLDESAYLFYTGEICVNEKESDTIAYSVNNGNTVKGKFTKQGDIDSYLTKASAKNTRMMIMITTDDYRDLANIYYLPGVSKVGEGDLYEDVYWLDEESLTEQYNAETIYGGYAMYIFIDIPVDYYNEGWLYYGLDVVYIGEEPIDYQYFACNITDDQYNKIINDLEG